MRDVADGASSPGRSDPRRRRRGGRDGRQHICCSIDGNSLTYRAFYALPDRHGHRHRAGHQRGVRVHVDVHQHGQDQQPDGVLVAFDRPEPTFRHEAEPAVQGAAARRRPTSCVSRWAGARGARRAQHPGRRARRAWEADDIIATLADQATRAGPRRDHRHRRPRQLPARATTRTCKVLYNKRGVSDYALYDEAGIVETHRRHPGAVPAVRGAARRPSDNLPGRARRRREDRGQAASTSTAASTASSTTSTSRRRSCAAILDEHEQRARTNLEMMRCAATRRSTSTSTTLGGASPNDAEVKRLFDFLEFRTLRDASRRGARRRWARRSSRRRRRRRAEVRAEVVTGGSRRRGGGADRRQRARRGVAAWVGRAGPQPARRASPSSPTRPRPRCCWLPATCSPTTRCARRGRRPDAPCARTRRQGADALAARSGVDGARRCELDTAIAGLPDRPGRDAVRARRPARALHLASSCPIDDAADERPARPRR